MSNLRVAQLTQKPLSNNVRNLSGETFAYLTVIEYAGVNANGNAYWTCICECGNTRPVCSGSLIKGSTKSCGCKSNRKHSYRDAESHNHRLRDGSNRTYNSWRNMIKRCYDPNQDNYPDYGGRGITVDDRWKKSFTNFLSDMGERPEGTTLDRKDPNSNYGPGLCKWSSYSVQSSNQRPRRRAA